MRIVMLGHGAAWRGLMRELAASGHEVLFLERGAPGPAKDAEFTTRAYSSIPELRKSLNDIKNADCVVVGSHLPDGVQAGELVTGAARGITAFYDMDAAATLSCLKENKCNYLTRNLIGRYSLYLSSAGGSIIKRIEREFGAPMARALYRWADPETCYPESARTLWDLGYMGAYSPDRQPPLDELMLKAARDMTAKRFVVAGTNYPDGITWPGNVERIERLPEEMHRAFYNSQRFTLNITRAGMRKAGFSPSARLFEAAACGTPVISDMWEGLELFFEPGKEVLVSRSAEETMDYILYLPERERVRLGMRARERVLKGHTAVHRAAEFEKYIRQTADAGKLELKAG